MYFYLVIYNIFLDVYMYTITFTVTHNFFKKAFYLAIDIVSHYLFTLVICSYSLIYY